MRNVLLVMVMLLATVSFSEAGKYNYVSKNEFKKWLLTDKAMVIVDIQEKDAFAKHHFPGSIETNAFPVKTDAQRKQIDPAVAEAKKTGNEVVVICPRGGGGAKRCYDYLKNQGVNNAKLYILKGGVDKWPHREMLNATTSGS